MTSICASVQKICDKGEKVWASVSSVSYGHIFSCRLVSPILTMVCWCFHTGYSWGDTRVSNITGRMSHCGAREISRLLYDKLPGLVTRYIFVVYYRHWNYWRGDIFVIFCEFAVSRFYHLTYKVCWKCPNWISFQCICQISTATLWIHMFAHRD